ncbi:DNA invertase Pin-like site-specific DNA recombinase [Dyadobacter sp. BE34]|uniref:DNA invertase Pin-like site-specific DNA recombinase n=1 Tax=Dyadobacter fermentans TaxID=94254 RepID=A0ABU1R961_9BACT|nr:MULTISPECIES: recombinase family protein [Dyadobacter]MDR6809747.1 DNA invertase Pin-like site-specific DNA recombinase [Dyadobacter fermentans]MDR7047538.1 DNA invertase Pin-like site-specific DNA recombinase [Dyadobacter sp. BE242]MDR7201708.1 DNA invertase Pin-like site-specific DNA recombinase [Dyadobacter sp. BE34]MDR7219578.1 DNA invertase Pin-like site-specific DNA recombinase [Dyadobacter sp. BE31]MDR7267299.1 DNA invertase Pin-like site-specific DNA recombinase [Dyadobacter sp. BE3
MILGYVRVSKNEQNQDLQFDALRKAGCEKIFHEKVSGASKDRPEYAKMVSELRKGDVIVVWRIDRLGRATYELIKLMVEWKEMGVDFRSISEGIDTSTKMGRLWYMLSSVFAENEREILMERTLAGMEAARARGRVGGRPKGLTKKSRDLAKLAATLYQSKDYTTKQICDQLRIGSKATLYNYLRHEGVKIDGWDRVKKSQAE